MSDTFSRYKRWLKPASRKSILWCSLLFLLVPGIIDWFQGWEMELRVQIWWAVMNALGIFLAGVTGRWLIQRLQKRQEEHRCPDPERAERERGGAGPLSRASIVWSSLAFLLAPQLVIWLGGLELRLRWQIGWAAMSFLGAFFVGVILRWSLQRLAARRKTAVA